MFRSYFQRLLVLVLGLVVVAQATTFVAVLTTLDRDARHAMQAELGRGTELLIQLFEKRSRLLLNSAEVLAADYGFKSAIGSRDRDTIRSALENNTRRIDADLASLISLDGRVISSTHAFDADASAYAHVAREADKTGIHLETLVIAEETRQIVVVPVKAPLTIAWLLLGFSLDDTLAGSLASQIGMEVSFSGRVNGITRFFGSSLDPRIRPGLPAALSRLDHVSAEQPVSLAGHAFLTRSLALDNANGGVHAVLQKSLEPAMQSYRRLRNRLIVLAVASFCLAAVLAVWMAHGVTRPVQLLSVAAARIRDGEYKLRLELNRQDEFGELADTFNTMQAGIAERELRIKHQASHDELTQLPNLSLARHRLARQIEVAERRHETIAIIVIGIERVRQVSDTLGRAIADRLLKEIATRISRRARGFDTVARTDGDEFMILATNADQLTVRTLVRDLGRQVAEPVILDAAELIPSIRVGVSIYPRDGATAGELIRRASIALTDAREALSALHFYEFGRDERHLRQLSLVADLKRAVDEDQLVMHYQPKIDVQSRRVRSVEALVRWIHPEHGFMPPDEFIGLAEKSGNISMLSNWVMNAVAAQVARWRRQDVVVTAAVNLSAMDLQDDGLPERVADIIARHGLASEDLIIEVTESAMMRDAAKAMTVLRRLRDKGITISIDDFGTGYSSLAKLRDLPIHELKIDRSFIVGIEPDTTDALIVKAIIDLGHSMQMKITTEGIENESEWNVLADLGSDCIQGYYISKPLPPTELAIWWQEHELQDRSHRAA